jgi:hypothetical protein
LASSFWVWKAKLAVLKRAMKLRNLRDLRNWINSQARRMARSMSRMSFDMEIALFLMVE